MRRTLTLVLAAGLLAGAMIAPADAKKKRKPPPPATFAETGSIAVGYPGDFFGEANVTRQTFLQSCAVPASQGTDGYVITLPEEITAVPTEVSIYGGDATGVHDLDIFFFDDTCTSTGSLNTTAIDEFGPMPSGTKYVLVTAFFGVELTFDFKATETRS